MSRAIPTQVVPRPTALDYLLILVGCSISLILNPLSGPTITPKANVPEWMVTYVMPILPLMLALPQGIILFWPIFYAVQRLLGRPQALSAGEWLLGVAWLGTVLLTIWAIWVHSPSKPDFASKFQYPPQSVWTIIVLPTLAAIALVIGLITLFSGPKQPWTHTFGLVLMIWPLLPLAGLLAWAQSPWWPPPPK
jgi:hypothetical protein